MRKLLLLVFVSLTILAQAQNVGIGTSTPAASAKLDITSTNSGLLIPRVALTMTTSASPIAVPATSLVVYNTATVADVTPGFYYWNGASWTRFASGSSSNWALTGNAGTVASTNFLGTTDANDFVVRTTNTERVRILATGNVGIGSAAPTQLLHVAGGSILTDRAYAASTLTVAASNIAFTTGLNPVTQVRITDNASLVANGILIYGATAIEGQYLWITNSDAQSLTFASTTPSTIIATSKTVGFVYTGGAWRAVTDAATSVSSDWDLLGNTSTNDPAVPVTYGTSTIAGTENWIGTTDANDVVIGTNTIERLRVKQTTGNVGIGLAAPAQPLDVYKVSDAHKAVVHSYAGQSSVATSYINSAILGTARGGNASFGYAYGVVGLGDFANSLHATGVYAGMSTIWPGAIPTSQALYANGQNLASSAVFMYGNVGMGTAVPSQQLEIGGTAEQIYLNSATSNFLYYNTNGVAAPAFTTRSVGTKIVLYPGISATSVDYAIGIAGSTLWSSVPEATITYMHRWYGGTTELMRLRGDGRLGIGTTNPLGTRIDCYDPSTATAKVAVFKNGGADGTEVQIGSIELFHDYAGSTDFNNTVNSAGFSINFGGAAAFDFQLLTNSAAKPGSGTWTITSDSRLKEDITPFKDGLEVVRAINPIYYKYNGKAKTPKDEYYIGILAQEMKEIAPYTVSTFEYMPDEKNPDNLEEYYSFNSGALEFVAFNAIKELDAKQSKVETILKNISDFGMIALSNGETFVPFASDFANNLNPTVMPVVTITPVNSDAQVSIVSQNEKGFYVKIVSSQSSVNVNWIAMAKIKEHALEVEKVYSSSERNAMLDKVKIKPTNLKGRVAYEREQLAKEQARRSQQEPVSVMPKDPIELKPVQPKTR